MTTTALNGAELAILNNRVEGIVRKMANTLLRTGRSGVLNRAKDFSCCIITADCHLLAAAESLPIHVLSGPDIMARTMAEFHPNLRRGDAFFHNSPYHGCSHAADLSILVPVIDADGRHRFTIFAKAHQADIGNSEPTTYMATARDIYNEGALLFPAVQVQRDYRDIADIIRMCELRIRVPEQWRGDYLATIGAVRIGERELLALGEEIGWDRLDQFAAQWFDYSENMMDAAIRELPAGRVMGRSTHDPFPGLPPEGVTVTAHVHARPDEGRITVDLSENIDCQPSGLNLSEACSRTAAMIGVFNSLDHRVPKNAGAFRRIEVILRRNCIAGITEHPYSCSAATTNISDRVGNAVQLAMAEFGDGFGMAEVGAVIAPSAGVVSGVDARSGNAFVNQIFLAFSAGAASPISDAWWTMIDVGNGGMCGLDGVELDEIYQPLLVESRRFVTDTEGAGRFTGAPSTEVVFGPVQGGITIAYGSDGQVNPPQGVRGGGPGGGSDQFIRRKDGTVEPLPPVAQVELREGEMIIAISTGGGGYGPPADRDAAAVARDVREGYVSTDRARTVYGVVLDGQGQVDLAATETRRAEMMA
ncbi:MULTISPECIES: hydantoinase B/oxoprolinase family protein [Paracoccus]|jgi:N-methylhydantoinase B|uniref:Hydantoinase B/oxoprolinase n=1 Tax=Paracoccus denitrificans (strain Pd 1222) TaxID=318586 RepID=A1AZ91_PARDP|nr:MULTISPECIES: hydantoinase B/oxoprolinase family protein [Paracoccus]ABL68585.1 Hydantoinase B/oxoprolinase [Paracoccus denitrificans PD1222]MBB4625689.1 N-methylhydantoinase B [Paracoccus denitrificans]MCU7427143.1 hydantoinase B/oxoprolinase family protein [Paracoccus denitrificans]QAR26649.1 hydantoinase B/oxoprolinase family protein [Paracoccus denitrificans]QFQ89103.1 hydantoinase B/oxoprolinase family protein [Paracoccus kondratievae]